MVSEVSLSLPNMVTYTVSLHPPAAFCFDRPDEWAKWKQRFEQFRQASRLSAQSEERQVIHAGGSMPYQSGGSCLWRTPRNNISGHRRERFQFGFAKSN